MAFLKVLAFTMSARKAPIAPMRDELSDLRRLNWALAAYARCTSLLIHSEDVSDLIAKVCEAIVAQSPYILAAVGLPEPSEGKPICFVGRAGPASGYLDGLTLSWSEARPEGRGPSGEAIRTGQPIMIRDSLTDPIFALWGERARGFGIQSSVTVPFARGGVVMGAVIVYASEPDAFGTDELALFQRLGDELAFALSLEADRARLAEAEDARRASEGRYERLFNAAASGIVVLTPEGRYTDANPAMHRLLGYDPHEIIGLWAADLVAPDEIPLIDPALTRIISGEPYHAVWRFRRKSGALVTTEVTATTLPDGNVIAIVRDITPQTEAEADRAAAEQALRTSEARYRSLFENAPDGMVLISQDGPYLDVNPSACRMLRYEREALIGKTGRDLVDEAQIPFLYDAAEEIARRGVARRRWRLKRADDTWLAAEVVSTQLPDGPYMSVITDLTERDAIEAARAAAEIALRESEARYRGLFDHAPDGIIVNSEAGPYIDINPSACEMLGYSREAFIGLKVVDLIGEAQAGLHAKALRALATKGVFRTAWRARRKDGSWIPTDVVTTRLPDNTYVSIIRDNTERDRSEAARLTAEEALRDTQSKLARAARVATLGEVVATISHEINQPLAAIVTNSDAAQRWLSHNPPDLSATRESLIHIARDSRRASQVIRRTREFLAGKGLDRDAFDLNTALEEVVALSRKEQRQAKVLMCQRFDLDLPAVDGDRTQIQQVALNLVLNALDAMGATDTAARRLTITTSRLDAEWALVEIEDRGPGLATEAIDRIFEQFFTTKTEGMGVGLAISRSIIDAHGGRIWAANALEGGAVFRFTVPFVAARAK